MSATISHSPHVTRVLVEIADGAVPWLTTTLNCLVPRVVSVTVVVAEPDAAPRDVDAAPDSRQNVPTVEHRPLRCLRESECPAPTPAL